ncbi:MAG: hypothetical protein K2V38_17190 [Gemmataceae bacterium]|nr:hypothetical protein [Gemmataceae bacterium]
MSRGRTSFPFDGSYFRVANRDTTETSRRLAPTRSTPTPPAVSPNRYTLGPPAGGDKEPMTEALGRLVEQVVGAPPLRLDCEGGG